jgi:nucleoid-associated protein YgaU
VPVTFGRTLLGASYAGFQVHTVVAGDTLFGIAQNVYGDGNLGPRFTANRDIISDPNLICVGQVLRVPFAGP